MVEAEPEDVGDQFPESWGIETPLLLGRNEDDEIIGKPPCLTQMSIELFGTNSSNEFVQ